MKKIDLHLHTIATCSDSAFIFSLSKLQEYVTKCRLDAIAITNHNVFDCEQFKMIRDELSIPVFPGIEINLCSCHLLLVSPNDNLDDFGSRAAKISVAITKATDCINVDDLLEYFGDLGNYLLIPHAAKKPAIDQQTLASIEEYVTAGEVDSPKKFVRAINDPTQLPPVLFSDARMHDGLLALPTRHTYIDCGELSFKAVKACLANKQKLSLSEKDGNRLFQVLPNGQMISSGLNVLLGERSAGKSYILNQISAHQGNVKYIKQFALVQHDEKDDERRFADDVERRRSIARDQFLVGFKTVIDDVSAIDDQWNARQIEEYIRTLIKSADETDRRDSFSGTVLFDETHFPISSDKPLVDLIASVRQIIENIDHRGVIARYLDLRAVRQLACELIERLWARALLRKKEQAVNSLVDEIKDQLKIRSSATSIADVDLYSVAMDIRKIGRFEAIVMGLRHPEVLSAESIQGFQVRTEKGPFGGAGELRSAVSIKSAFKEAFAVYNTPFRYLQSLKEVEGLAPADFYKLFTKISFRILNRDGFDVSGGERSEFRLLQEIKDAQACDMLLIDEPESSFDNMFLHTNMNELLKDISRSMPVVVVTHNSTVGATIGPDYVLYSSKSVQDGKAAYRLFGGYPTDKLLYSLDGESMSNYLAMVNSLEAGKDAYERRGRCYEAVKD